MLAWRHVRALRDPGAWDAWLYRLTVRACTRLAQANRRRDLVELAAVTDREPAISIDFPRPPRRARSSRSRAEPAPHRSADGHGPPLLPGPPLTDIADILGIPVGTAKSRLHRGLATLRSTMATEQSGASPGPGATGMSQQLSLEQMVAGWMTDEATGGSPDQVVDLISPRPAGRGRCRDG